MLFIVIYIKYCFDMFYWVIMKLLIIVRICMYNRLNFFYGDKFGVWSRKFKLKD